MNWPLVTTKLTANDRQITTTNNDHKKTPKWLPMTTNDYELTTKNKKMAVWISWPPMTMRSWMTTKDHKIYCLPDQLRSWSECDWLRLITLIVLSQSRSTMFWQRSTWKWDNHYWLPMTMKLPDHNLTTNDLSIYHSPSFAVYRVKLLWSERGRLR